MSTSMMFGWFVGAFACATYQHRGWKFMALSLAIHGAAIGVISLLLWAAR